MSKMTDTARPDRWIDDVHAWPEPCPKHVTVAVVRDLTDSRVDAAERFVHDNYVAVGYIDPNDHQVVLEHEPVRARSWWVIATADDTSEVSGCIRLVPGTFDELPCSTVGPITAAPPSGLLVEWCSICVSPSVRGMGLANELHRVAAAETLAAGAVAFLCSVEPWHADVLRRHYGLPLVELGPGEEYMGGHTVPYVLPFDDGYQHLASVRPGVFWWLTDLTPHIQHRFGHLAELSSA
jgi:hypothetical protein